MSQKETVTVQLSLKHSEYAKLNIIISVARQYINCYMRAQVDERWQFWGVKTL